MTRIAEVDGLIPASSTCAVGLAGTCEEVSCANGYPQGKHQVDRAVASDAARAAGTCEEVSCADAVAMLMRNEFVEAEALLATLREVYQSIFISQNVFINQF